MVSLDEIKNRTLEDDGTPYGGVMFAGETAGEFLGSIVDSDGILINGFVDLDKLNEALIECGIKPLCI